MAIGFSNKISLGIQRRLSETTLQLGTSFERLSSGLRINRASDDAAGQAVVATLSSDAKVYSQAIRNVEDGISLLDRASSAVGSLNSLVIRLQELAEQAASGTLTTSQKGALNAEADELVNEYNRIIEATDFNNRDILKGDAENLSIQAGIGETAAIVFSLAENIKQTVGTGELTQVTTVTGGVSPEDSKLYDLNGDGNLDLIYTYSDTNQVRIKFGNGDGTFGTATNYATGLNEGAGFLEIGDFNNDGAVDLIYTRGDPDGFSAATVGETALLLGNGDGTFQTAISFDLISGFQFPEGFDIGDINGDGNLDVVMSEASDAAVYVAFGDGTGGFSAATSYAAGANVDEVELADLNNDGYLDLVQNNNGAVDSWRVRFNNGDGTFGDFTDYAAAGNTNTITTGDVDRDGDLDVITQNSTGEFQLRLNNGDGTFGGIQTITSFGNSQDVLLADMNNDGYLDIVSASGNQDTVNILFGNGDGTFQDVVTTLAGDLNIRLDVGDIDNDGVLDVVTVSDNDDSINVLLNGTETSYSIEKFNLYFEDDAQAALDRLDEIQDAIELEQGVIGANESRLGSARNALVGRRDAVVEAYSKIRDVDIADEVSRSVKLQVLQSGQSALLEQANQQAQIVLQLLNFKV